MATEDVGSAGKDTHTEAQHCVQCRSPLKPGAVFCHRCGTPLSTDDPVAEAEDAAPLRRSSASSQTRLLRAGWSVGLTLACVFGASVLIIGLSYTQPISGVNVDPALIVGLAVWRATAITCVAAIFGVMTRLPLRAAALQMLLLLVALTVTVLGGAVLLGTPVNELIGVVEIPVTEFPVSLVPMLLLSVIGGRVFARLGTAGLSPTVIKTGSLLVLIAVCLAIMFPGLLEYQDGRYGLIPMWPILLAPWLGFIFGCVLLGGFALRPSDNVEIESGSQRPPI